MDINVFTQKAQQAILAARDGAARRHHQAVAPGHLLEAVLGQTDTIVYPLLTKLDVNPAELRGPIDRSLASVPACTETPGRSDLAPQRWPSSKQPRPRCGL